MSLETLDDIVEQLSDKLGVYGSCGEYNDDPPHNEDKCRVCFTSGLKSRILESMKLEQTINLLRLFEKLKESE